MSCHLVRFGTFVLWPVRTHFPYSFFWTKFGEDFGLRLCLARLDSSYFHFLHVKLVFSMFSKTCLALLIKLTRCVLVTCCDDLNLYLIFLVILRLFLDFVSLITLVKLFLWRVKVWILWCSWSCHWHHFLRLMLDFASSSFGGPCYFQAYDFSLNGLGLVLDLAWSPFSEALLCLNFQPDI